MSEVPYAEAYTPPAPILPIAFSAPEASARTPPVPGFVDTRADATIVPLGQLESINARATVEMSLRSYWGEARVVTLSIVDVHLSGVTLPGIEVVGDDQASEVVIGRDVLNRLHLSLDGLRRRTSLLA